MIDDNVYTAILRDDKDTYSQSELTGLTECGAYSSTSELWGSVDRPVTKEDMARSGIRTDFPCREHSDMFDRPNTKSPLMRYFPVTNIQINNQFWSTNRSRIR